MPITRWCLVEVHVNEIMIFELFHYHRDYNGFYFKNGDAQRHYKASMLSQSFLITMIKEKGYALEDVFIKTYDDHLKRFIKEGSKPHCP